MTKKNEDAKPKKVLGTGAAGDPDNPEAGAPTGAMIVAEAPPVVTETKPAHGKDQDR
jgi:hypothetical protein